MVFWKKNKEKNGIKVSLEIDFYYHSDITKGQQLVFNNNNIPLETLYFHHYVTFTEISFIWKGTKDELNEFLRIFSSYGRIKKFIIN